MADLDSLPDGAMVFVDTIIFDLHYRRKSAQCERLLKRIATGDVTGYVDTLILTDLMHKLMLADAFHQGLITTRSASKLRAEFKGDRSLGAKLIDCHKQFRATLRIGLKVRQVSKDLLVRSEVHRLGLALLTGDSVHTEAMLRASLADIATHDTDFDHVPSITVWSPSDVT